MLRRYGTVQAAVCSGRTADGWHGAGGAAKVGRRTLAVVAMFGGALIGSVLVLAGNPALDLLLALGVAVVITVGVSVVSRSPSARVTPQ